MSNGQNTPLDCCDRECARLNKCSGLGGTQCVGCGDWYCDLDLDEDSLCADCAEERRKHTCKECGGYDPDLDLDEDGLCETCRKEQVDE